tara:strand:- start:774 stop:1520 length:747 start_codon:yes stop_codon:yes gene_type:complete
MSNDMKVAVCISGIPNSSHNLQRRNVDVLKEKFPDADFYYATWKGYENEFYKYFPNDECLVFDEPIMHYHPYFDITDFTSKDWEETKSWVKRTNKTSWSSHHTKQILIHAMLVNSIDKKYDIIVRTRFDAFVWKAPDANFTQYIKDTKENYRANCFAVTRKSMFKNLYESDYIKDKKMKKWILDQLIIHPRNMIDYENIMTLHTEKSLRAAEYGWHQTLSEPYSDNHRNWHGWVNHDKNVEISFIREG